MKMTKKNKILLLVLLLGMVFSSWFIYSSYITQDVDEDHLEEIVVDYPKLSTNNNYNPSIEAEGAFSLYYDTDNQKVLYEKNPDTEMPIASITKMMTALVAFEKYDLNDSIEVTESDIVTRTEFRDFRAWNKTTIEELLYQMIIESNNSGAFAIALISDRFLKQNNGSVETFVLDMNRMAKEIGLERTAFINPSGLDTKDNYNSSTPREIALFSKYLIENNGLILNISKMPSYRLYSPDKTIYYEALNTNVFLREGDKEWQERIVGGKTGWTRTALGCLFVVLEAPQGDGYIINVVLGAEDRFLEMEKLINYVEEAYIF